MTEKESIKWLWDKLNFCYVAKNTDRELIYLYYDKSYIRKRKLCRLKSTYDTSKCDNDLPDISKSECLFVIDYYNDTITCSSNIYQYLRLNYSSETSKVEDLILFEFFKFNIYTNSLLYFMYLVYVRSNIFKIDTNGAEIKYLDIKGLLK